MTHSGIDLDELSPDVRPQDDLFRHANGVWLKDTVIPDDRPLAGSFTALRDASELAVRTIIEEAAAQVLVLLGIMAAQTTTAVVAGRLINAARLLPEDLRARLRP